MKNKILHTKFGNAIINRNYYVICTRKEGNRGKLLHRLIWEDFYGYEIPKGYHIHHKNGNPLDNCILNLQLISKSEHHKLHNSGKNNPNYGNPNNITASDETKIKMSKAKNTSGYFRVTKHKDKTCKQGYIWDYIYYENNKSKKISSVSLKKLEKKVKSKGLLWKKLK